MIDDILEKVTGTAAKLDPSKVVDLVDELWDSRKKIVEAVDFVWDNRDEIGKAVEFVRDHADELLDLLRRLPGLLAEAGDGLATAGSGAQRASAMLLGDDGDGVREFAADAADALERAHGELAEVMEVFAKLDDVPFMDPVVAGGQRIGAVADDLVTVAGRLRGLGGAITDAGENLDEVGRMLTTSGTTLQGFAPEPAKPATKRKRPTAKKSSWKKNPPAKKKAPAKKKPPAKKSSSKKKAPAKKNPPAKKSSSKKKKAPAKKRSLPAKPKG